MSVDDASLSSINKHIINIPSTPNTPNFTHTSGNTSQSMTPSEFGYQHLNRQSAAVTPDVSPKSPTDIYEQIEQSFSSYVGDNASRLSITPKPSQIKSSPIKSTINIIYKSPIKKTNADSSYFGGELDDDSPSKSADHNQPSNSDYEFVNVVHVEKARKPLLETSFDENMVYEQVKFFKGAVSEVNLMLNNGNETEPNDLTENATNLYMENFAAEKAVANQVVPNLDLVANAIDLNDAEVNSNQVVRFDSDDENNDGPKSKMYDISMSDQEIDNVQDSLEIDPNISLYENVELPKPDSVYENVDMKPKALLSTVVANIESSPFYENVSKPGKLMVRQLANKFETSPVDAMPPFDFSRPLARKLDNNRNSPCMIRAKNNKQLHNSAKITRSLDENAFVREFGKVDGHLDAMINNSVQQLSGEHANDANNTTNTSRRMSLEFVRPKSLNPPKRLPDLSDTDGTAELCKYENVMTGTTTIQQRENDDASILNYNLKITPTTENPISLIQHNVNLDMTSGGGGDRTGADDDDKKSGPVGNAKVLGSFKLDRERIEKIKEERRHQLNEKFRSESFKSDNDYAKAKSKSKTELRDIKFTDKVDPLRFKSKSRGDVRSIRDLADCAPLDIIKTLGLQQSGGRVRRISDEKNQNDCTDYVMEDTTKLTDIRDKCGTNAVTALMAKGRRFERKDADINRDRDCMLTGNKAKGNTQ